VVAIIGILAAIAIPLYVNVQTRARISKAQADTRTLASTITIYTAHMGTLPATLNDLTAVATNGAGQDAGPFLARVPTPPLGGNPAWDLVYTYTPNAPNPGQFTITAAGDNTNANIP